MAIENGKEIIHLEGITKRFGGVLALNNVSLEIKAGEVHAVLGENGAGKSTLMKILAGVYTADAGKIILRGEEVHFSSPRDAQNQGISIVFQELNLFPQMSVSANIFMNRELTKAGLLDENDMRKDSSEVLRIMDVDLDPDARVETLRQGDRQLVEIARALYHEPNIIIMDEPNSALNDKETQVLFDVIHRLSDQGVTILYISHRLEEVFEIADRISVFRDGKFEGVWNTTETSMDFIVSKMIGRKLEEVFPVRPLLHSDAPVTLQVRGLSKLDHLEPIDFDVRQGEVLGFAGLQGCGIEDIFQILFGLESATGGEIIYEGETGLNDAPYTAIQKGWGMVPAERRAQGLMMNWTIKQNMSLTILGQLVSKAGLLSTNKENKFVNNAVDRYRISTDSINKLVIDLSGGNQQKVVVAKWLATNPKILLLNDPTRGIDVGAKAEIYSLVNQLAKEGMTILFTSSEVEEVLGLCDRILILYKSRLVKEFEKGAASKADVLGYVAGSFLADENQPAEASSAARAD